MEPDVPPLRRHGGCCPALAVVPDAPYFDQRIVPMRHHGIRTASPGTGNQIQSLTACDRHDKIRKSFVVLRRLRIEQDARFNGE
jgi:hypothetical protein